MTAEWVWTQFEALDVDWNGYNAALCLVVSEMDHCTVVFYTIFKCLVKLKITHLIRST